MHLFTKYVLSVSSAGSQIVKCYQTLYSVQRDKGTMFVGINLVYENNVTHIEISNKPVPSVD